MKCSAAATVKHVVPGSIAEEAGIIQGDVLHSINGEMVKDIFDYRFLIADVKLLLEIRKKDGEVWEIEIEKDEYEDLGLEFENPMLDDATNCINKCIFCFIDQLPKGMRKTLYFKDDDSRLSFLTGNYVTLTNVNDDDIGRLIRYRMSPINVSVHTTNPDLRMFMLKNRFAGDVVGKIKRLTDAGIMVNCQIVLCRGINDGPELDRTLSDLSALYPGISSISVVPVGVTRYREGLADLKPYDMEAAISVIDQVSVWQSRFMDKFESRVVYLADEFYILAEKDLPCFQDYEDFPQLENGVGLIALLKHEICEYLSEVGGQRTVRCRKVSIATGVSVYKHMVEIGKMLEESFCGLKIAVYEIKNLFFGENVTVAGLLTGRDILLQLKGMDLGDELLICRCMLKSGENIFLDDFTVDMLGEGLGVKVTTAENSGKDFVDKVLGMR